VVVVWFQVRLRFRLLFVKSVHFVFVEFVEFPVRPPVTIDAPLRNDSDLGVSASPVVLTSILGLMVNFCAQIRPPPCERLPLRS